MRYHARTGQMRRWRRWVGAAALLAGAVLGACARPVPPPAPPPPPPPVPTPLTAVWTARPDVILASDSAAVRVPRPFSRLEVVAMDSLALRVVCRVCPEAARGRVARADVVKDPLAPDSAARASLAEFALAVRAAAERRDLPALRALMARDFSFSLVGAQGRDEALAAWRSENFRSLDRVPELLDRGLSPAPAGIWAAPPEYAERFGFRDLRLGFRQNQDGRWEWTFLMRAEGG